MSKMININDLHREQDKKEERRIEIYVRILDQVHQKIKLTNRSSMDKFCFFTVPTYVYGLPLFDVPDSATIFYELSECRKAHPNMYIKINAFNNARGVESTALSFITDRPNFEPGFYLVRQEGKGRNISYTIQSYAVQAAGEGSRY